MAENMMVDVNLDLIKSIANQFNLQFAHLYPCYDKKIKWFNAAYPEHDKLGIINQLANEITNMIFTYDMKITVPSQKLQDVIDNDLMGRMRFQEMLAKNLFSVIVEGDGVAIANRNPLTGKPDVIFVDGINLLPTTYSNHHVEGILWFDTLRMDDTEGTKLYLYACRENNMTREIFLYELDGFQLTPIEYGTQLFRMVVGNVERKLHWGETGHKKFGWISLGIGNIRWRNTPFNQGICWNKYLLDQINHDYDMLEIEYAKSSKKVFYNSSMLNNGKLIENPVWGKDVHSCTNPLDGNRNNKKLDLDATMFESVDLREDMFREFNPEIRFMQYQAKLNQDLQLLGKAIGLGENALSLISRPGEVTATQTLLNNREAFNTIRRFERSIGNGIKEVILGLCDYWLEDRDIELSDIPGIEDIKIEFSDGVFVDKYVEKNWYLQLASNGIIGRELLLKKCETFTDAELEANLIDLQNPINYVTLDKQQQAQKQAAEASKGGLAPQTLKAVDREKFNNSQT